MCGIRDRVKELRRIRASELLENPKNFRRHPRAQQTALRAVLQEIGYADALIAYEDGETLTLIDGHLRADTTPDMLVPVLVVDLTAAEADKLLAVFDPLGAMAINDNAAFESLRSSLTIATDEFREALGAIAMHLGVDKPTATDDVLPELKADRAIVTKPGDLWVLGKHRILCGDSTSASDVQRLFDGAQPFIMVTDPPYGVDHDPHWREEAGVSNFGPQAKGLVTNDDKADWTAAYKLFTGRVAYVWHAGRNAGEIAANLLAASYEIRTQIIWRKPTLIMGRGHYHWQHEPCWYAVRPGGSSKWCGDRDQSTIWEIKSMHVMGGARNDDDNPVTGHSTQKPVECMARPIRNHGTADDDVYDPFLGSGTTVVAAEQIGRRCFGMEIAPAYVDLAVERWERLTGKKAERIKAAVRRGRKKKPS